MTLEQLSLDSVLYPFIGEIHSKLIEGVGSAGHVLQSGEIEEANECGEVVMTEMLVNALVEPSEEKGV